MSTFKKIEDIEVWQKARSLTKSVYDLFKNSPQLKRDFTLKDQAFRATFSIMLNIAEGFARNTDKEFTQFLYIAKGSASELKSIFYILKDTSLISSDTFNDFYGKISEVEKMLSGLISYLKRK